MHDEPSAILWAVVKRPGKRLQLILRTPRFLYRRRLGWLLGHRFLLLTHVGRRTGESHETVLEVLDFSPASGQAVVMSGWGPSSDWFCNIETNGKAQVTVGRHTYQVEHRVLEEEEAMQVLADYERRNRWLRPIVRRVLSGLMGSKYDGSEETRRSVIRQLPIVAFSPIRR